jgi:outer membrane protein
MTIKSKTTLLALSLAILTAFPVGSFAQAKAAGNSPSAGPSKIAFVNIQEAVITCNEGKQESAALQQRFTSKQAALKAQDDELKKLKDDFQAASSKLNDDERNARQRAIQDKQKIFERNYADYQSEAQEAQQDAINKIVKKMLPVLEKYLLANGYTAAIDVSNPQTPVIWVNKEATITEQLVNAYNAQGSASTPATQTPPRAAGGAATPKP